MTHQVYAYVLLMIEQCFVRKGKRAEKRVSSEPRHLRSTVRAFTSKKSTVFRKHVSLRGKQYLEIFQTRKLSGFPSHIPVYRFSLLRKRYLSCKHQNVPLPFKISWKKKISSRFYTKIWNCYSKFPRMKPYQKGKNSIKLAPVSIFAAALYLMYVFFWVIPRRLNFICRRFGTLCLFHLHRHVGVEWLNLTFRRLMSYIYGAPILDVSRSHTTTQHSR